MRFTPREQCARRDERRRCSPAITGHRGPAPTPAALLVASLEKQQYGAARVPPAANWRRIHRASASRASGRTARRRNRIAPAGDAPRQAAPSLLSPAHDRLQARAQLLRHLLVGGDRGVPVFSPRPAWGKHPICAPVASLARRLDRAQSDWRGPSVLAGVEALSIGRALRRHGLR